MYNLSTINEYKLHNKNTPIENLLYYTEESIYITEGAGMIAIIVAIIAALIVLIVAIAKKTGLGIKALAAIKGFGKVISEFFKKRSTAKKESYYFREDGEASPKGNINIENDRLVKINNYISSNPKEINVLMFPEDLRKITDNSGYARIVGSSSYTIDANGNKNKIENGTENEFKSVADEFATSAGRCMKESNGENTTYFQYSCQSLFRKLDFIFKVFGLDPVSNDGIYRASQNGDTDSGTFLKNLTWSNKDTFNIQEFQTFCTNYMNKASSKSQELKQKVACKDIVKLAEIADRNIDMEDITTGLDKMVPALKNLQNTLQQYQNSTSTGKGISVIKSTFDVLKKSIEIFDGFVGHINNFSTELKAYLNQIAKAIGMTEDEIKANIVDIQNKYRIHFD